MCLAVPGKIVDVGEFEAIVDLQGNRLRVSTVLTPGVTNGEWVLVHAGFAITTIEEEEALRTWDYLEGMARSAVLDEAGMERGEPG